jgi:hypothetical protein
LGNGQSSTLQNKVLGFELGQKIFNPQSGYVPNSSYIDRPFAGYLYIGSTLNFLYQDESNLKIGAQLAAVGPASLAKQTQNFVHDNFGFYHTNGWQYQIDNDFELNLSAEYNKLLGRTAWGDISLASYGNLGNGLTGAGAGALVRLGNFNKLFNSVSTQSTATKNGGQQLHPFELFFYYKPLLNYVAYDATVEGSLFGTRSVNSMEVTGHVEPLVFSQQFGVAYSGNRLVIDAAAIFHTKDVKEMLRAHQWGSVTVLYRFH